MFEFLSANPAHLPAWSGSETPVRVKQEGYTSTFETDYYFGINLDAVFKRLIIGKTTDPIISIMPYIVRPFTIPIIPRIKEVKAKAKPIKPKPKLQTKSANPTLQSRKA